MTVNSKNCRGTYHFFDSAQDVCVDVGKDTPRLILKHEGSECGTFITSSQQDQNRPEGIPRSHHFNEQKTLKQWPCSSSKEGKHHLCEQACNTTMIFVIVVVSLLLTYWG